MLLVLMGLAMLSFMAKDSVTLRLHPVQGKTYTINTKATTMNLMEVQGQTINSTQAMETRQTFTVKETNDTQTVVDAQTENMKMSVSQMGMKFEYDSDHPEKTSPMIAEQTKELAKSIKQLTTITYDAMGNVVGDAENQVGAAIIKAYREVSPNGKFFHTVQWTAPTVLGDSVATGKDTERAHRLERRAKLFKITPLSGKITFLHGI